MRHVSALLLSSFIIFIAMNAVASPADPDRPIPETLIKLPYEKMSISSSSVARGFTTRNLFKMKAWRAWGSEPDDRVGAWVKLAFDQSYYLDTIHFVPGDERAPGFYDVKCGRPAKIEFRGDFETRTLDLEDVRWHQYITFDPPIVTRNLKMTVRSVRGESEAGGVCLAALSLYAHHDPLRSVPDLRGRIEQGILLLQKPLMRSAAKLRLSSLGPAVASLLFDRIVKSRDEQQKVLLDASIELMTADQLAQVIEIEAQISEENQVAYLKLKAALGDRDASANLMSHLHSLDPADQASLLRSIAASHNRDRLPYLLDQYGRLPEVDEVLREHIPYFRGAYRATLQRHNQAVGRRKAALLELLAKVDPVRARTILRKALQQREDSMWRSGGIRGVSYSTDEELRMRVRRLVGSVYGVERRSVAYTLAHWGEEQDLELLKELARDKSMSVRKEALIALGQVDAASEFLMNYALYGSDQGSAAAAAQSWLGGEARLDVKAPLKLMSSPFSEVRRLAADVLLDHRDSACEPLTQHLLTSRKITSEQIYVLEELWASCHQIFMDQALVSSLKAQERALVIAKMMNKPEFSSMVITLSKSDAPEVQVAVSEASELLGQEQAELALNPYLSSKAITTRCAAMLALAKLKSQKVEEALEKAIRAGLKDPYLTDRAELLCAVDAVGLLGSKRFASLLSEAYQSWSKSLGFLPFRRRVVSSIVKLPSSPARLSVLMSASTDLDQEIRSTALVGLRKR